MTEAHSSLRVFCASRYLVPLREGGTLPAIVEEERGSLWVLKFRGAGQGARALVAEVLVAELARAVGLPVPEVAMVDVPEGLGRGERDPEIQDLLQASRGINVGMAYLEGAFNFDPAAAGHLVSAKLATQIVWFDTLVLNPDRTPRNPNLLIHEARPWLIDHGAALYPHFNWPVWDEERTRGAVGRIEDHVLLAQAEDLRSVDRELGALLLGGGIESALQKVPDALLSDTLIAQDFGSIDEHRARYRTFLETRLQPDSSGHSSFIDAAEQIRSDARQRPPQPMQARR